MFVNYNAVGSQKACPSSLPSLIRQVGVFKIERIVKCIESTHRQELLSVKSAGSTSTPEDWGRSAVPIALGNLIVVGLHKSQSPRSTGLAGFFATLGPILKENLA